MLMDSRPETYRHIQTVQKAIGVVVADLMRRAQVHDQSKLVGPEVGVFDEYTPKLAGSTYGSDEYKSFLAAMKPALDHHYNVNDHHPEHFSPLAIRPDNPKPKFLLNGEAIRCMSLVQLMEMLCDWKAATLRHNDGDLRKSIEINQKRFGYSDELKRILLNTVPLIDGVTQA